MKANERSANKVRGYLLATLDGELVFRVYTSADRKEFKDYKIRHQDLEVEIVDNYSSFFDEKTDDYDGFLDYPSRLLEKKVTTVDPVVQ